MLYRDCVISNVYGREILDSRGNPTLEVRVTLSDGTEGTAAVPSGASTGAFEAVELRDGDGKRYGGKGVLHAVEFVNTEINRILTGVSPYNQRMIDNMMISADGTPNKRRLGANSILGTSLAVAKAAAQSLSIPLFQYVGGISGSTIPVPMMNIINGGAHAANTLDVQEFMIVPVGAGNMVTALMQCSEVYHKLRGILKKNNHTVSVGDEGGFAPDLKSVEEVLDTIAQAIDGCGYTLGRDGDFMISLDVAASEWKFSCQDSDARDMPESEETCGSKKYLLPKSGKQMNSDELIEYWENLVDKYPIFSLEDPLDEEDWDGWRKLTEKIGDKTLLVGDDLFVTNSERLSKGINCNAGNAILIKPNQIGSLTETIETIKLAKTFGYKCIMSHRSGETEDTTIADLAVALNTGFIKTGAPCRSERVAKYNRLLRIEDIFLK